MKKTLQEIADYVGGRVAGPEGAGDIVIHGLDNIEGAGEHDLTFAVEPHIEAAKTCQAAAVMLPEGTEDFPKPALYVSRLSMLRSRVQPLPNSWSTSRRSCIFLRV